MTRKQMKKVAKELAGLERLHDEYLLISDDENTVEIENRMLFLTSQIASSPNGLQLMDEIDAMVQEILNKGE